MPAIPSCGGQREGDRVRGRRDAVRFGAIVPVFPGTDGDGRARGQAADLIFGPVGERREPVADIRRDRRAVRNPEHHADLGLADEEALPAAIRNLTTLVRQVVESEGGLQDIVNVDGVEMGLHRVETVPPCSRQTLRIAV